MKESSGKTRKVSKGVRRARTLRNIVMMILVCALMLSAATYAWFTLSKTAKVANLTMTVGEQSSLMIAPDKAKTGAGQAGLYGNTLTFGGETDGVLYKIPWALQPATMTTAGAIMQPEYDDEGVNVIGTAVTNPNTHKMTDTSPTDQGSFFYYETTFYLKTAGNDAVNVQLAPSTLTAAYGTPSDTSGTYVVNKEAADLGAAAIRIKLTDGTNTIVYQPLSDYTLPTGTVYESATDTRGDKSSIAATSVQDSTGAFTSQSQTLTVGTTDTRITMTIWLEGTDNCCVNQIMADQIIGQLAFEVVDATP